MHKPAITGSGVFTPENTITNAELAQAFNAYADKWNAEHADAKELRRANDILRTASAFFAQAQLDRKLKS